MCVDVDVILMHACVGDTCYTYRYMCVGNI